VREAGSALTPPMGIFSIRLLAASFVDPLGPHAKSSGASSQEAILPAPLDDRTCGRRDRATTGALRSARAQGKDDEQSIMPPVRLAGFHMFRCHRVPMVLAPEPRLRAW
jgi:hypothetical protein